MTAAEWRKFAETASLYDRAEKAKELGADAAWDCERAKTPEGYYQVRGGIPYAIAKSLAAAPFADILWMETKTADLADAKQFADAIHAVYPDKMLAYNLSPSFNWDTTGMSDDEMRAFPEEIGKMGFVFNFMTYGGHQIDGVAAEEFATALQQDGMLALARLQRKMRLVESPYRTPQTLVGGPRSDAALAASSGRTATTKSMGKGSTQHQHLVQTEVPKKLLEEWLALWSEHYELGEKLRVQFRPLRAGGEVLELGIYGERDDGEEKLANVLVDPDQGPQRPQHPDGARPEHLRRAAAPEAPDDVDPPLADPPLQGRRGVLRDADRGQRLSDREDEVARHLQRCPPGRRRDHRRRREPAAHRRAARTRPRGAAAVDPQGGLTTARGLSVSAYTRVVRAPLRLSVWGVSIG